MGPNETPRPSPSWLTSRASRLTRPRWTIRLVPYAIATVVIAAALVIRIVVDSITADVRPTYLFFFPFVALAAYFGLRAGLFA